MMKPIIALYRDLKDEHKEKLQEMAPDHSVKVFHEVSEYDLDAVEIILGWNNEWDESILEKMPNLKWIQKETAGMNAINEKVRQSDKLLLSNMSGIHADSITQSVFAFILSHYRGFYQALKDQQESKWNQTYYDDLVQANERVLLIYGTGALGKQMAKIAKAFDMVTYGVNTSGREVEYFDKTVQSDQAETLIADADVIINTMPLTRDTRNLFDAKYFEAMKNVAIFINVGRGESVVEDDLIGALENGEIASAYLDVTRIEPLPAESGLWHAPNLVITPHSSGAVEHFRDGVFGVFSENLAQYLKDGTLARNQYSYSKDY